MSENQPSHLETAVENVIRLEEELEAAGFAMTDLSGMERLRAILHQWVDEVTATVVSPGLGRVTLIHRNGRASTISSPDLPFLMSEPITAYQA